MWTQREFYELLTCSGTEVSNLIFPKDEVACVSWRYSEDNVAAGKYIDLAVAVYVTIQSRLKLYEYLSKLGQSVPYRGTDSVIFVQKDNDPQNSKHGIIGVTSLMSWRSTDLAPSLKSLCRVALKTMFSVFCLSTGKHATKCKVKGITLNYENSKVVNFTALRNLILEDAPPVHVHNPQKIKRKQVGVVVPEPETKEYKIVFKNRRLMDDFDSVPYGNE